MNRRKWKGIDKVVKNTDGDEAQQCDMNSAATHLILFECINHDTTKIDWSPPGEFKNTFLEYTMSNIPSVVIQCHETPYCKIKPLADIIRSEIPLLLLDSRHI